MFQVQGDLLKLRNKASALIQMKLLWSLLSVLMAGTSLGAARDIVTPDFQKHVVPLLGKLGCVRPCHGSFKDRRVPAFPFRFDFQQDHAARKGFLENKIG